MHAFRFLVPLFLLLGCTEVDDDPDRGDGIVREVRGGRFHHAPLGAADAPAVAAELLQLIGGELAEVIEPLGPGDFQVVARRELTAPDGGRLIAVSLQQLAGGVPMRGARLDLTLRPDAGDTVLLASSYRLYHDATVDLEARIGRDQAVQLARAGLRADPAAVVVDDRLLVDLVEGRLRLAWGVGLLGHHHRAVVLAAGDDAGRVIVIDERRWQATGVVRGLVSRGAPGRSSTSMEPMVDLRVGAAGAEAWTHGDGGFVIDAAAGEPVRATLAGRAVLVSNAAGAELEASAAAGTGLTLELAAGGGELALAQTTTYQVATAARRWLVDGGAGETELGAAVTAHVNEDEVCNAYYSPLQRSLHFFRAGGGCRNSAEPSLVAHEYGHLADDAFGGIADGGLSEGWGDLLACFLLDDAVIGGDLFPGGGLRRCDNDYRYPRGGVDEVHELGQAWAGFAWHLRQGLIARLGAQEGAARARALVVPVLVADAADIPAAVRQVFLLDDDDGDLDNGTPHWEVLALAAERHDLGFVIGEERGPPAAVRDLAAPSASATRVTLRWTAPGDDGRSGMATRYELRWSDRPIDAASFAAATAIAAPAPRPAGSIEELTVAVPPVGQVWFGLRVWDDAGNASALSNVVAAALRDPVVVFAEGAEQGPGRWHLDGLWQVSGRAAAEGSHAFWYGIDDQGDYDTGAASIGALVSPVVDLRAVVAPVLVFAERVDVEDHPERDLLSVTAVDIEDVGRMVATGKQTGWTGGEFRLRMLDLAPLAGRVVRIEIVFDTVDGLDNRRGGWFIDDLRVVADEAPPAHGRLVINEILADPPVGFDAGGDGAWSYRDDEMLELLNAGSAALDLGGATIEDAVGTRFTFPAEATIPAGGVLVVFGGGTPQLSGVAVLAAPGGLQLNNDGDVVRVRAPGGEVLAEAAYGAEGGLDQSVVRAVDGDPLAAFVLHRSVASAPASPGRRHDGSPF